MAKIETTVLDHLEWLGFVQPTGLVVSAPALVKAGAILDRHDTDGQRRLRDATSARARPGETVAEPFIDDFEGFARIVLGWNWSPQGYAGTTDTPIPDELTLPLPVHDELLAPTYAVRERDPAPGEPHWQLLVLVADPDQDLDAIAHHARLEASPHGRLERLLRHTGVTAGLLTNGRTLRLISAPKGETSGWLDLHLPDMVQTAGRPMCSAMRLLLSQTRLLTLPKPARLSALLLDSRKYQNDVSERLAEQVLHALYELLRGLQAANAASRDALLADVMQRDPNLVYRALLTVLLRLVFLLYAEERGLLPQDDAFLKHYSLTGLHDRLREDVALNPDTMDQRYGAWAQLLVLFRLMHDGAHSGHLRLPARHGELFDPDRYPFLEGQNLPSTDGRPTVPLLPDGTIARALEYLLVLDGERLSYRALDVEQIGSVYETMMGFRIETTTGRSLAIRAQDRHGAPTVIDLDQLSTVKPGDRATWITDHAGRKPSASVTNALKNATGIADLHAALHPITDQRATPDLAPPGALVLQPSDERRRSGSHYTPRELTEPIVRTTLEPILARLAGDDPRGPTPEQILDLKVCDPAMGSGAFLVEACRQLGDALVAAWRNHDATVAIPSDEDATIYARRLIAPRCLYGVDRNPVAVDLSKVSLWLITLARDHPLTFLDHALRHGDSLVGLSKRQLQAFHWDYTANNLAGLEVANSIDRALELRELIRDPDESVSDAELRAIWADANDELARVRLYGDLVIAAFFEADSARARETKRLAYAADAINGRVEQHAARLRDRRHDDAQPLAPFHWQTDFPEVFERTNPGFDAFVGNPPFAGKNSVATSNAAGYPGWLKQVHRESHGNADLVAHFFRRTFDLLRTDGALGLIATNTIGQGDTRSTGLRWICQHGGAIYAARKRVKWPGLAAVVVSVLHISKGAFGGTKRLNEGEVETITAFLFHRGGHDDPARLATNAGKSFVGSYVLGMGFTFDDTDTRGVATPLAEMRRLIDANPRNQEVIFPYIGGEEVNTRSTHVHHRYVINFGGRSEEECRERWPELMAIVEERVRPVRQTQGSIVNPARWWMFARSSADLVDAIAGLERVLVISRVGQHAAFGFLPNKMVYAESLIVFPFPTYAAFASLQSRPHELWARFFGSSMKDDLRYTPSDCFETFPFPENWASHPDLEAAGRAYYKYRAQLMIENDEGLTQTYNRFHDPNEHDPRIVRLRELHAAMDRAVLGAYGWSDIATDCEFLLDYEIDEEAYARRRKPYRYRWPDEVHDEVLGRLLDLNATRAAAEAAATAGSKPQRGRGAAAPQGGLF